MTRRDRKRKLYKCVFEGREGAEWSGVTFRGSREKESCDRQPEAKTRRRGGDCQRE